MTGRKHAKKKIVILGVLAFLVCAFLVFFIADYLEAQKAQRALSGHREQWRVAEQEKEEESQSEPAEEPSADVAEAENPEPDEAVQQTEPEPAAEPEADNSSTAAKKEPAEQPDDWMPQEMREFDNADDYAEACFYDYYDIVVAESMDPGSPLYGLDDVTLIKIAYDDAYDDWYRYH